MAEFRYDERVKNRMITYHDDCMARLRQFHDTGYPHILVEAVYSYAVMREYGLQFELEFPDFDLLYQEARVAKT
jgi:hypothetical protein